MKRVLVLEGENREIEIWKRDEGDGSYLIESFDEDRLSLGVEEMSKNELINKLFKEEDD